MSAHSDQLRNLLSTPSQLNHPYSARGAMDSTGAEVNSVDHATVEFGPIGGGANSPGFHRSVLRRRDAREGREKEVIHLLGQMEFCVASDVPSVDGVARSCARKSSVRGRGSSAPINHPPPEVHEPPSEI
jgi:hypothetical protein